MSVADRLKAARFAAGFTTASDAARRFGWTPTTYFGHENGSRGVPQKTVDKYARAFRVTQEWLLFGRGQSEAFPAPLDSGTMVDVYNVEASAGHGALVDYEAVVDRLSFPPGYLQHITSSNPKNLAIINVKGESMLPTLADGDLVMVDKSKRDLSFDGLFVLQDGGASLLVKRVGRAARRGFVMLISDNRAYPPIEREVSEIEVVGKVIWAGVKV